MSEILAMTPPEADNEHIEAWPQPEGGDGASLDVMQFESFVTDKHAQSSAVTPLGGGLTCTCEDRGC